MKLLQNIKKAHQENIPFVAYRDPNSKELTALIQNTDELFVFDDFGSSGYVFAPFDDNESSYLLKADRVFKATVDVKEAKEVSLNVEVDKKLKNKHVLKVQHAIDKIQSSSLRKIVVSRKETLVLEEFDAISVFENLLHQYKNAYVYIWFHPKVGLWLGATPETLLKVEGTFFKTMSLAGTQAYKGDLNPDWGAKELEEQQMVSEFIKSHLENTVTNLRFSKVETVKAGSLLHLKTTISGELNALEDVQKLVTLLHPTPAVCGLPKEESKAYILKHEGYKRSFYTGYLGVLNLFKKTSLYVNLRCFSVIDNDINLYVGGGITKDSNSEKEWFETIEKSQTIKKVLY